MKTSRLQMSLFIPYPAVDVMLSALIVNVQRVLGGDLVGLYLEGSLALGDFDEASDIDFVAVTNTEVSESCFGELSMMHAQLATLESPYVFDLEGSYLSKAALRRYDPSQAWHPNLERGRNERLKMAHHNAAWIIHRFVLREHGVRLLGPQPQTLVDPVSPADLRGAVRPLLADWGAEILNHPQYLNHRGYQSYTVLTLCRNLYTLHHGTIASKPVAAHWAQQNLAVKWSSLIERAGEGRHNPEAVTSRQDQEGTLGLLRSTLELSKR